MNFLTKKSNYFEKYIFKFKINKKFPKTNFQKKIKKVKKQKISKIYKSKRN